MRSTFFALFALIAFTFAGPAAAQKAPAGAASAKSLKLAKMLPESDAVLTLDVQRLFKEALPQILSGNQTMLGEVVAHADKIKSLTGIDIKDFDRVVVGATIKRVSAKEVDLSPVVLAEGKFTPASLQAAAKLASHDSFREETIAGKTVYIFTPSVPDIPQGVVKPNSTLGGLIDRAIKGITSKEIAVGALNTGTVVFGPVSRVRQALEAGPRASATVLTLSGLQHGGIGSFGAKLPTGLSAVLGFDNDEIGKSIDTVKFLSGWMDQGDGSTILQLSLRTAQANEAQELLLTLQDLQAVGKALIGGKGGPDKQAYSRMIDAAKFSRINNELTLDLKVLQTDINILIGDKKAELASSTVK